LATQTEQIEDGFAMFLQALSRGGDFHSFFDGGDAGGKKLVAALDFNQAEAAGAHVAEAVEMAEGGDVDVVLAGDFENGLAGAGANFLIVDGEGFDVNGRTHASTSNGEAGEGESLGSGAWMLQTPAAQRLWTM
jgi:hypothetical protein